MPIRDTTKGFSEDQALRERYQKEGFGLETVFVCREWAEEYVAEVATAYDLTDADVRLVKHISSPETGEKTTWEVYVKRGKGLPVLPWQMGTRVHAEEGVGRGEVLMVIPPGGAAWKVGGNSDAAWD